MSKDVRNNILGTNLYTHTHTCAHTCLPFSAHLQNFYDVRRGGVFIPGVISQLVHKNEVANCSVIWILIANTLPPLPPTHTRLYGWWWW